MIVLVGKDAPVLSAVRDLLIKQGCPIRDLGGPEQREVDGGDLFMAAFESHAETIIGVDTLPHFDHPEPPDTAAGDRLLAACLRATRAPGVKLLVWVTSRAPDDPGLVRLAQDGAAYTVVRAAPVAALEGGAEAFAGQRVLVRHVAKDRDANGSHGGEPARAGCSITTLAGEVAAAAQHAGRVGGTIEVGSPRAELLVQLVSEAGALPELVPGWKAAWLRCLGVPCAIERPGGVEIVPGYFRRPPRKTTPAARRPELGARG